MQSFIPSDDVVFEELVFNLGGMEKWAAHEDMINQLVQLCQSIQPKEW